MSAIACVDVAPLGCPGRYSMTPRQQRAYRAIAAQFGTEPFRLADAARLIGTERPEMHVILCALVERGWACRVEQQHYALTSPVMSFREATQ